MHRSSFGQPYQNGGGGGGRSPYAYASRGPADRNISDLYDYVDEQHNVLSPTSRHASTVFEDDDAPDILHVKYLGELWSINFPPYSIAEEKVLVSHVRARIASRLGLEHHPGRVKLLYKDKELKRDDTPLRKYGCKQNSEISVIKLQESRDYSGRRERSGSDSDSVSTKRSTEATRPFRSNSTYRKRDDDPRSAAGYPPSNGYLHPLDTPPSGDTPPRQPSPIRPSQQTQPHQQQPRPDRQPSPTFTTSPRSSAPAVQPPQADLSTPLGKIQSMRYEWHSQWVPAIENFLRHPPSDKDERTKEYRRLNEVSMKRVFEPGDAIEPEGKDKEEIRATRKQLYAEAQGVLNKLDKYKPSKA